VAAKREVSKKKGNTGCFLNICHRTFVDLLNTPNMTLGGVEMVKQKTEEEIYKEASKRVKERKRFYSGLVTYAVVNAVLVVIWALTGQGYMWFLWPLGIWGVFVLGDFLRIFVFGKGSDDEAIKKEVEKIKREQP
jgi:hypothetical protein